MINVLLKSLSFRKGNEMETIKKHIEMQTKIYSLEHGVGKIIGIFKYYDGVQDYIEVKFDKHRGVVNLYPSDYKSELRIISNPLKLTDVLKRLSSMIASIDYTQESQVHQRIDADVNLDFLTDIIASHVGSLSLQAKDKMLLSQCIDSLILEVSHVYKINELRAKGIVSDYMRAG